MPVEQSADPLDVGKLEIKAKSELVMNKAYNDMNERLKKDWCQLEKYHKAVVSALSEARDQKMTLPGLITKTLFFFISPHQPWNNPRQVKHSMERK